jgi:1-deoxy-D-xylulose-5-phosphate synthase
MHNNSIIELHHHIIPHIMQPNLLSKISYPQDIENLSSHELHKLSDEIREYIVDVVSKIGGHLGANLGVVELTVALHYVFNMPKDKIIWDIGHQSYTHKILTGRKDVFNTIRQEGGLSGFCNIKESEYDIFGAGHSSTSISAALGIAIARDLNKEDYNVISVIGDSAMTAGMAYEAINNAGSMKTNMIVILNDNDMSISPSVGALKNYLGKLINSNKYMDYRFRAKSILSKISLSKYFKGAESVIKDAILGHNIFEAMGFYYCGPIDGHNIEEMVEKFEYFRDHKINKPVLIHIKTNKCHGFEHGNNRTDKFHGVGKFDINTGLSEKSIHKTYSDVFGETLISLAQMDEKVVAITPAMILGSSLSEFQKKYPDRTFDVAIAEQHAVTFSAGMAITGYKPYCIIYSTFMQRSFDQFVHDVAIQSLPVRIILDRAGFVGQDGATHNGMFDIMYTSHIPNVVVMAPKNASEMISMLKLMNNINDRPSVIRYPRANALEICEFNNAENIELGKMEMINKGSSRICIISYGHIYNNVKLAFDELKNIHNLDITLINGRFAKPIDDLMLKDIAKENDYIFTAEEGSSGGFGSVVSKYLQEINYKGIIKQINVHDEFDEHGSISNLQKKSGLDSKSIINHIIATCKR